MITSWCQRWRERRDLYRPKGEVIQTRSYEVAPIASDREARAFVTRHHYSGTYVAARLRCGLYHRSALVGVAVLSQPPSQAALEAALPFSAERCELGRFVLLDEVPANGESWFLARLYEQARAEGFEAIVAHSDPEPRHAPNGAVLFGGHVGTIYQASNARYTGRSRASTWRLFADGSVFSARAWTKLRQRQRGYRSALEQLVNHGAAEPGPNALRSEEAWRAWVRGAVSAVTSAYRHPGTHRYVWALDKRLQRHLPPARRYPKFSDGRTLPLRFEDRSTAASEPEIEVRCAVRTQAQKLPRSNR